MKDDRVKVQVMLDLETIKFIKDVAKLAGTDQDTVVNVILAAQLLKWEREDNDAGKEEKDKSSNGSAPKRTRVAKRTKSRSARSKRS